MMNRSDFSRLGSLKLPETIAEYQANGMGCRLDSECFHASHLHSLISVTVTPSSFKRLINSTISTNDQLKLTFPFYFLWTSNERRTLILIPCSEIE